MMQEKALGTKNVEVEMTFFYSLQYLEIKILIKGVKCNSQFILSHKKKLI